MATSGSVNYSQQRNDIILDAYQLLNVYGRGRTVSGEDMQFANNMLNKMVKAWQAKGIHLWKMEEGYLFPTASVAGYDLASSSVHAAEVSDSVITSLNGSHNASTTTLVVDTTSGMLAGDYIGVVLSDNTVHWTTIVTVNSSTGLTITSGLASAAADNANVYTYTSTITKPLKIHNCRRVTGVDSTATEIVMKQLSQDEYDLIPLKNSDSAPVNYMYNPKADETTLYLWPRPANPSYYFKFRYSKAIEDFDNATDSADFPSEWLECLTYQLALRLAPPFGKADLVQSLLAPMASQMLQDLLEWDNEVASINLGPEIL